MDPETLRKFISQYPELCVKCWSCDGKGVRQSLGGYTIVDCWECFRLGKQPSIEKMVYYLLEKKNEE